MSSISSTSSVPRPLQLVDGNVPSPRITSPPASSISSPARTSYPTPLSPISVSTPSSSKRPASANPRRQSSISYYPSDHNRVLDLRSPTSPSSFSFSNASPTVRRSNSLGVKGDRRSLGLGLENLTGEAVVERPPLTLTEKHADLLSFIAQKEAKCLELRSQLSLHEAELKDLKRKWERIVSRGMDRAYSTPSTSSFPTSASPYASVTSTSSLLTTGNGAVLDGIKEGVQEVGRLLASGLGSAPMSATSEVFPGVAGVSRSSMTPALKKVRHLNTQSVSSVSTAETSSTSRSGSSVQRLSQSSASSLGSIEDEDRQAAFDEDETKRYVGSIDSPVMANVSMSPSSEIPSSKLLRRRSREVPKSPLSPVDDGSDHKKNQLPAKRSSAGLPPASSIPGIGSLSMLGSVGTSVGKKWEEIQKGETFTKSQKRASLLLSDMSHSIFAALASPTTPQTQTPASAPSFSSSKRSSNRHTSTSSISVSSNPFLATLSPISPLPSPSQLSSHSGSLLDDEPEEYASGDVGKGLGEVMVPNVVSHPTPHSAPVKTESKQKSLLDDDDDDWNW